MRLKTAVFASLMTAALLFSALLPSVRVRADIPEPFELYGVARDENTIVLSNGEPIRSFIDGVDYSNKTSVFSRPSMTEGLFDIDTYGNHKINETVSTTPWIKEGGNTSEPIMYTWGDMSNNTPIKPQPWITGIVFKETRDWQTNVSPQPGDLNAALSTVQPPLLKIWAITTHSMKGTQTDYVWLCNPTDAPVQASDFYIEKNILGNFHGPQVQVPAGTIAAYDRYFVDLGSTDYFVETGDAVKLVWKNDPLNPNAPFGGMDIVVDRVEFNATTGGTLYWEPGNTDQPDEVAPPPPQGIQGFMINRTKCSLDCRDTNSASKDFYSGLEDRKNRPPEAPYPICVTGVCSNNTDSRLYHLTITTGVPLQWNHTDPDGDPQTSAEIQMWTGPGRSGMLLSSVPVPGPGQTYNYGGTLNECSNYYFNVRTKDAYPDPGAWAELRFHTNCKPKNLLLKAPPAGATVTPKPDQQVWWSPAQDDDPGDSINYTWKVSLDFIMTPLLYTGTTQNNYSDPFATIPSTTYYWCVEMSDGWQSVTTSCLSPRPFNTGQVRPPSATPLKVDGKTTATDLQHITNRANPALEWQFTDPDAGDTQTAFHVQVKLQSDDSLVWELNTTGTAWSTTYAGPALTDGTEYYFLVKVRDSSASLLWGSFSTQFTFRVNTPPPVPTTPVVPASGTTIAVGSTTVQWTSGGADAEGDTVTYEYIVDDTTPPAAPYNASGTASTTQSSAFTTTETKYYWSARAYDGYEYSAWSVEWNFSTNTPPTISLTAPPNKLKQGETYRITWTMNDVKTAAASLVVYLNYTYAGGSHVLSGRLVGATYYDWTVPTIERTDVRITAIVIDAGGLNGTAQTPQFEIYREVVPPPPPTDLMPIIIAVVIIIVVLLLLLFFLMKRKKPKEEEEAPPAEEEAPAEEEVAEEELVEEEPPKPAPRVAPVAAAKPAAKPGGKTKECPSCGTIVSSTDKECFMCGAKV